MHVFVNLFLFFLLNVVVIHGGLFGRKKEDEKMNPKDSVALGIDMMKQTASDPDAMKEAMAMMNDPETKKVSSIDK